MNKFVKYFRITLITVLCLSLSLLFVACGEPGEKGDKGDKGDTGAAGVGIVSIAKDSTSGNVDTYKITLSDGNTSTFTVTNGTNSSGGQNGKDGISVTGAQIVNGELVLSFSEGNPINLGKVVGENGKDGQNGTNGQDGKDGVDGTDGKDGADGKDGVGIKGIVLSNEGELTITLTNDTPVNLGNVKGQKGDDGLNGQDGVSVTGASINSDGELVLSFSKGDPINLGVVVGAKGQDGKNGTSLEDVTLDDNGNLSVTYGGTTVNLGNIKGQKGDKGDTGLGIAKTEIDANGKLIITYDDETTVDLGVIVGAKGETGVGIDTITLAESGDLSIKLTNGNTVELGNIKGQKGDDGQNGQDGVSVTGAQINDDGELVLSFSKGDPINLGKVVGKDGTNGQNGTSLEDVTLDDNGNLSVTYGGTTVNLGNIKGQKGDKGDTGLGIAKTEIDANGKLIITYDDETTVDLGVVVGAKGETGVGIQSVSLVDNNLTITLTNGTVYELGNVKGDKGDKGDQGDKGDTGAAGKSAYEIYKEKNPSYTGDETQWMSDLVNGKLATVEVVKHTVTFDSNGGTPVEPQQVQEGKKAIQPQNPTREGYTFLGWYGGLYGNEKWVFIGYPVTEPITLTAKWEINSYTLTFDSNDGSAVENDVVVYNTNYTLPQPTKDGFVFAGWLIDGILYEQETIVVKQDLELVAKWVNPTYTLSFNTGFDDVVLQPQTINYKQQYTLPQFQKDGYTFLGWCDENGNKIEEGIWKFDQDMTLTAQWRGLTDMFEFEKTTDGVVITKYVGNDADVVVPATITQQPVVAIDANAFANNVDITSVAFDGSFTNFSEKMFAGCTNLQKLTISSAWAGPLYTLFGDSIDSVPSSLVDIEYATNSVTINPTMWQSKVANHNVSLTLANDVATIPADQFSNCDGLTHVVVPQGVTRIGEYAFEYCSSLTSVVISSSVTSIGEYIFHACYDLTICCLSTSKPRGWHRYWDGTNNGSNVIIYWGIIEFVIDSQGINYLINNTDVKVLQYNGSQVEIVIPDKIEGYAVTKIDENVFKNNTTITSITIPASVKNIGDGAFYKCNNLAKVTFGETSQLETIGASAFYGCDSLINIVIPSSVTSIGTAAFHDCSNLNIHMKNLSAWCNISFGGSLSNPLDNSVDLYFNNTKVTGLVIPNDVTEIKAYAFYNFDSITSVTIPNSVTSIGSNAFANCDSLDSVYITDLATWCNISFDYDSNPLQYGADLYIDGTKVTELVIPNGIKEIKDYAFYNYDNLTSVTIPADITSIGKYAFYNCDSIDSIYIADITAWYNITFGSSSANPMCNGADLYLNQIKVTDIAIPNVVTEIKDHAFNGCTSITSVSIHAGVTSIGSGAFKSCKFTTIEIPSSVISIGEDAFYECRSLESVTFDENSKLENIGSHAFYNCDSLESVVIPSGVTSISTAFYHCDSLESIVIPSSVTSIDYDAFGYCGKLKNVTFGENSRLKEIDGYAFRYCENLESIVIPSSVASIGYKAFWACGKLKSIELGENSQLETIGMRAFDRCESLISIIIPSGVTFVGEEAFNYCRNLIIYCEATNQPSDWNRYWNYYGGTVYWYSYNQPISGNYWHYVDGIVTKW